MVVQKVLSTNVGALNETYRLIRKEDISTAVDWMIQARASTSSAWAGSDGRGAGGAEPLHAHYQQGAHDHRPAFAGNERRIDGARRIWRSPFPIPGRRRTRSTWSARPGRAGAKVIGITRFTRSPLSALCDLRLLCGANEGPLQGGSMSAKMSQLFLLDVLYVEYFKRTYETSTQSKAATADAITSKLY